jgi:hypothetical protein
MKSHTLISLTMLSFAAFFLSACGTNNSGGTTPPGNPSQWTWVNGSNLANQPGTYGTLGMASPSNVPGGRQNAVGWTDKSGFFWLFGGLAPTTPQSDQFLNDLWKYSAGEWTWVGGSNAPNQPGIYGTLGTPDPNNIPGARCQAVSWSDAAGNFWLFGGLGLDSGGGSHYLNDLWKYSAGEWTWIGGSNLGDQPGTYGTEGMPSAGNVPGARSLSTNWTDAAGNFWLFGGVGYDSTGTADYLNDLWKFSAGEWEWVSGSNLVDQPGTYGTQGTAAPGNVPGARLEAGGWTDPSGNLWLFGGSPGPDGQFEIFNDLWKYSAGEWTWVGGSNSIDEAGIYGTQGTAAAANIPGSRVSPATWTDASGILWLFGGDGYDSIGNVCVLSDLWKYGAGEWTWIDGSNLGCQPGIYGTLGTAAAANVPGARYGAVTWTDSSGKFWLLGGNGFDSTNTLGDLNDLWKYGP